MDKLEEKLQTLVDATKHGSREAWNTSALSHHLQSLEKSIIIQMKNFNKNIDDRFRILEKSINSKLENVNKNIVTQLTVFKNSAESKFNDLAKGMAF